MRRMPILVSALLATIVATAVSGCAVEDKPAAVKEQATSPAPVLETESTESPSATTGETEAASETTAPPTPTGPTIGDLVTVGDWDVKVTKVVLDAGPQIESANQFNDRAKGQYVLVTFEATYTGDERSGEAWLDLTWSFTTTDSQVNDQAMAVTQADDEEWPTEARPGGTIRGQAVFDLPKKLIKGGILTVEAYDASFDTVYADFTI